MQFISLAEVDSVLGGIPKGKLRVSKSVSARDGLARFGELTPAARANLAKIVCSLHVPKVTPQPK